MTHFALKTPYSTQAICLKTLSFQDTDKILSLYSPEWGRIDAIAKGVGKPHSKLAGACQPLNLSTIHCIKGQNLDRLVQYQPVQSFVGVHNNLLKLAFGLLAAELVLLLSEGHDTDSHDIFGWIRTYLSQLDTLGEDDIVSLTALSSAFQLKLLGMAGYQPNLSHCLNCQQAFEQTHSTANESVQPYTYFLFNQGGGYCHGCLRLPGFHQQLGNTLSKVSNKTLQALASVLCTQEGPLPPIWQQAQLLKTQKFLQHYIQVQLERDVHAYHFLRQLLEQVALN